jgi:hypothetical protein
MRTEHPCVASRKAPKCGQASNDKMVRITSRLANKREVQTGKYDGIDIYLFRVYGIDQSFVSKFYNKILHTRVT